MAASAISSTRQKIDRLSSAQETVLKNDAMTCAILTFVPNTTDCSVNRLFTRCYLNTRFQASANELMRGITDLKTSHRLSKWLESRPHVTHIDLRKLLVNLQQNEGMETLDQIVISVSQALKSHSKLQSLVLPHEATHEDVTKIIQSVSGHSALRALDFSSCTHPNFNLPELIKGLPKMASITRVAFFLKEGENQVELFNSVSGKFPNAKEFSLLAEATQPPLRVHTLFQQFPHMERLELEQFNFNEKDPERRVRVSPEQWKQLPKLPALKVLLIRDCVFTQYILNCILAAAPARVRWDATGNLQGRVALSGGRDGASPSSPKRAGLASGSARTPSPMFVFRTLSSIDMLSIRRNGHDEYKQGLNSRGSFDQKGHCTIDSKDGKCDTKRAQPVLKLRYSASSGRLATP